MEPDARALQEQLDNTLKEVQRLENLLNEFRAELEQARRGAASLQDEARIANEELQHFVYAASHDLQEPLRAIRTYAQLLQRECVQDKQVDEFVSVILDGTNTMDTLVRDLLNYSRTGSSPQFGVVNLNAPLQWALLKMAVAIRESGAEVAIPGKLPDVCADERQIATVFEQLITNCLRYRGKEYPRIEVASEQDGEFCTVLVRDNGEGIPAEYHEQVFVPFKRLHGRKIAGSGLGLAICRKIVRAHGGRIWVESDGEHGSTVKFTIPF